MQQVPIHPLARLNKITIAQKILLYILYAVAWVTYVPLKFVLTFAFVILGNLVSKMLNIGQDLRVPLSQKKNKLFHFLCGIFGRLFCIGHGMMVVQKNKHLRDKTVHLMAGNHCSYLDAMVMTTIGGGSAVVNQGMADMWFLRDILKYTRALVVQRPPTADDSPFIVKKRYQTAKEFGLDSNMSVTQQMQKRVNESNWHQIIIFPEGTTKNSKTMLKFRTSAFCLDNCTIQPFCLKYRTLIDIHWLTNSGLNAMLRSFLNPIGIIEITWLPVQKRLQNETPQEFADRVGQLIADKGNCHYCEYKNDDMAYFMGWKPIEKASQAYLRDFQWLGTIKDIRAKHGARYQLNQPDIQKWYEQAQK